jgi:ABC-type polysaccharide/polyol phosphate transport system ATPase subunit
MATPELDNGALAIEVRGLCKRFRIPTARPETLKERVVHPLRRAPLRDLEVLDDISFDARRGEFLGIVGRNASGKSTLLKLLASIYRADRGRIRVAGKIAPIIELGVGFQPDMTARDNVITNALMLGLTPREARRRFDEVIEFAELEEFVDMKLKNYSSGMRVRLAFAIAIQVDPDVLLLDEVLAVGDPPFQQRCQDVFKELKSRRTSTIVLVTHAMANIERHCDRAMLLEGGRIEEIGDPTGVAKRYTQLRASAAARLQKKSPSRIVAIRLLDPEGASTHTAQPGMPLRLHLTLDADEPLKDPRLILRIADPAGTSIFMPPPITLGADGDRLGSGQQIGVAGEIENKLAPGRYYVHAQLASGPRAPRVPELSEPKSFAFDVPTDGLADRGLVLLDHELRTDVEPLEEGRGEELPTAGGTASFE